METLPEWCIFGISVGIQALGVIVSLYYLMTCMKRCLHERKIEWFCFTTFYDVQTEWMETICSNRRYLYISLFWFAVVYIGTVWSITYFIR